MRQFVAAASVVLVALLGTAPSAAARAGSCERPGAKTLEAGKEVRVFYRGNLTANRKYACFLRTGRITPLGVWDAGLDDAGIANLVAVSGSFVAYHDLECAGRDGDCAQSEVRVLNARTGRLVRSPKAGPGSAGIAGLVVRANGHAAYLREYADGIRQLHLLTATGDRILDASPAIEPFSLAFAGRTLYWTRAGAAQSAAG
jgi:hypothetical protein